MYKNSPFPHLMPETGNASVAPVVPADPKKEAVPAALLHLITNGLYEEVIERETWLTAQELIDASNRKDPDRNEDLRLLIDLMSSEGGKPVDAQVLGSWLETVKGIEYEEVVLVRSHEGLIQWGVLFSGGDVLIEISDEADPDSVMAALDALVIDTGLSAGLTL